MTENLKKYLQNNLNLESDLINKFVSEFIVETFKPKNYFLRNGWAL